jgi:hypothetical protein
MSKFFVIPAKLDPEGFKECLDSGSPLRCARKDRFRKRFCSKKLENRKVHFSAFGLKSHWIT